MKVSGQIDAEKCDWVNNNVPRVCGQLFPFERSRASAGRGWKLVLPAAMVSMVFHYFHSGPIGDHLGVLKTIQKIRQHFIWKGMDADIRNGVRYCKTCEVRKPAQNTHSGLWAPQLA